jgi:hypothetical protein
MGSTCLHDILIVYSANLVQDMVVCRGFSVEENSLLVNAFALRVLAVEDE